MENLKYARVAQMLEAFGGRVDIHAENRDDEVVGAFQREYGKLPDEVKVLNMEKEGHGYIPVYYFYLGEYPNCATITIFGQGVPTRNIAEQHVNFWRPKQAHEHEEDCPAVDGFGCRCGEAVEAE